MESFYGIDETPEEQTLRDAASFSAFVAAHKREREKDEASKSFSKSKREVETEEADVGDDNDESCRGITRIHRSPSRPRPSVRPTAALINIHEHPI